MNNKGVTLIELLIVVVVLGIVSSIAVLSVGEILENTRKKVDQHNAEFIVDLLDDGFEQGYLEINGSRVRNLDTGKNYSGTGRTFVNDFGDHVESRINIQSLDGRNSKNKTKDGYYRFKFLIEGDLVHVYYHDEDGNRIILATLDTST